VKVGLVNNQFAPMRQNSTIQNRLAPSPEGVMRQFSEVALQIRRPSAGRGSTGG
jgi:hypothetical protein